MTYRIHPNHLTVIHTDERGEDLDLNADGEPCTTVQQLADFISELAEQGAYDENVREELLEELVGRTWERETAYEAGERVLDGHYERQRLGADWSVAAWHVQGDIYVVDSEDDSNAPFEVIRRTFNPDDNDEIEVLAGKLTGEAAVQWLVGR